jgi:hypothetical protein
MDRHEIRQCLGLCTYYRWFISCFSNITKPLTKLTEEKQAIQWIPEMATFQILKEAISTDPIHSYPQPGERSVIDTVASNVRIGGVLSQIQYGQEQVIAYYSKTLYKAERNYCITRWEQLATVRMLEHFHEYHYGQEFHLSTDHSALTWLMYFKNL